MNASFGLGEPGILKLYNGMYSDEVVYLVFNVFLMDLDHYNTDGSDI